MTDKSRKDFIVPVEFNDQSVFDGAFTYMKQRFNEEMRRIEDEMINFSKILENLTKHTSDSSEDPLLVDKPEASRDPVTSSPLVEGRGDCLTLKLQFDVSLFEPNEIFVNITNGLLSVAAHHKERTDTSSVFYDYHREFILPPETDPETVKSMLSKDGILMVTMPLHYDVQRITSGE